MIGQILQVLRDGSPGHEARSWRVGPVACSRDRHRHSGPSYTFGIEVLQGHVAGTPPERFRGRLDLPLTALGRRQIAATSRRINAAWRIAAIYTSPMSRCVITGQAIAASSSLPATTLPGLNDIDYGEWQGLTR